MMKYHKKSGNVRDTEMTRLSPCKLAPKSLRRLIDEELKELAVDVVNEVSVCCEFFYLK